MLCFLFISLKLGQNTFLFFRIILRLIFRYVDIIQYKDKNPNKYDRNKFDKDEISRVWSMKDDKYYQIVLMLLDFGNYILCLSKFCIAIFCIIILDILCILYRFGTFCKHFATKECMHPMYQFSPLYLCIL